MRSRRLLIALVLCGLAPTAGLADIRCIDPDEKTGTSLAVVVNEVSLAYTGQLLPLDTEGKIVGKEMPTEQIAKVFDNLGKVLGVAQTDMNRVVKVNVYAARTAVIDEVKRAFPQRFRGQVKPAVSFVVGALPHPEAVVALDAVAVISHPKGFFKLRMLGVRDLYPAKGGTHLAVLPPGPLVYVAGQAEKGDLAQATRRTLESLRNTLKSLDLDDSHIVQLKAFLTPMAQVETLQREMRDFFGKRLTPPLVLVEWKSSLPIEIELIAAAPPPKQKPAEALDFLTPPGMTASPIYSRVARINYGQTVYVSGLYGLKAKDAAEEVELIFTTLGDVLKKAGSNYRHLAKATYYVATEESSRKLNELRPKYYDPKRPPSASKAMVPGVGIAGRSITLDMIGVVQP